MVILSNFNERLKELMFDKAISAKQLAVDLNVTVTTVYRWINTHQDIPLTRLVILADYFQCSTDFLVGISDADYVVKPKQLKNFGVRIREVLKEKGRSTYWLRKVSRFESIYFQNWDAGSSPSLSILLDLAKLLDCTIDYLIGRE